MATTVEIPEAEWERYFDAVTHKMDNATLSIETSDGVSAPQLDVSGLALQFLVYDVRDKLFEVAGRVQAGPVPEVLHHLVAEPLRVAVDCRSEAPGRIEVDGADGARTVITLDRGS